MFFALFVVLMWGSQAKMTEDKGALPPSVLNPSFPLTLSEVAEIQTSFLLVFYLIGNQKKQRTNRSLPRNVLNTDPNLSLIVTSC